MQNDNLKIIADPDCPKTTKIPDDKWWYLYSLCNYNSPPPDRYPERKNSSMIFLLNLEATFYYKPNH